jgi:hypothetical protein
MGDDAAKLRSFTKPSVRVSSGYIRSIISKFWYKITLFGGNFARERISSDHVT